jgi:hypothetical protein
MDIHQAVTIVGNVIIEAQRVDSAERKRELLDIALERADEADRLTRELSDIARRQYLPTQNPSAHKP